MLESSLLGQLAQRFHPMREAFAGYVLEVAVEGEAGWNFEVRKWTGNFFQAQSAALGDIESTRQHFRRIFKDVVHFVAVLDVELCALELHPVRVLDRLAGLNANHHVL